MADAGVDGATQRVEPTCVVRVEGKLYDVTEFLSRHPGGITFISMSEGRDITTAVNTYHKNPDLCREILKKYEVKEDHPYYGRVDIIPNMRLPPFLIPPNFNQDRDLPKMHFSQDDLQPTVIKQIKNTGMMVPYLRLMDKLFHLTTAAILFVHLFVLYLAAFSEIVPQWMMVLAWVCTRTSLAAAGHYALHRKAPNPWMALFDFSYVGISFLAIDGHTMLHHMYTRFQADVKIPFFSAPMLLPRMYRMPVHTIHRFGLFISGLVLRAYNVRLLFTGKIDKIAMIEQMKAFGTVRVIIWIEFLVCLWNGLWWMWALQFTITVWWNLFLIVASHELEAKYEEHNPPPKDWGVFQVDHAFDMTITGNEWVDIFLSAGLSCHRVHHLLPFQKSGFANIACKDLIQKEWEKRGHEWKAPHNYWTDLLPKVAFYDLWSPSTMVDANEKRVDFIYEHFSVQAIAVCVLHIMYGFIGEGAV